MGFLSKDVKGIRKKLELDYEDFAKLIGVSSRSVRRWEKSPEITNIPGSTGIILSVLQNALRRDSGKITNFVKNNIAIGGFGFLFARLLNSFFDLEDEDGK